MSERLFEDFPPVSTEAWHAQLIKDLKGAPLSKLGWENDAGIPLGAVYRSEDLLAAVGDTYPGMGDLRRGQRPLMYLQGTWEICTDISVADPQIADARLAEMKNFPDAVRFVLPPASRNALRESNPSNPRLPSIKGHGPRTASEWSALLKHPLQRDAAIRLHTGQDFLAQFSAMAAGLKALQADTSKLKGDAGAGPLDALGIQPVAPAAAERFLSDGLAVLKYCQAHLPQFRAIRIDLEQHALHGAHAVHEMAYALAMAVDYATHYGQAGLAPADIFRSLGIHFPVSTDFFGEIARFRAFRMLWAKVLGAYGLDPQDSRFSFLAATGSRRQLSALDPETNILRATTQAMSAVLGGCDSVSVPAYDEALSLPSNLSLRLAANLQRVLRDEAALGRVIDPAGGAYFVEQLTDQLAERAWALFQKIESAGGYLSYLQAGKVAADLQPSAERRSNAIRKGRLTVLGVNQYPNAQAQGLAEAILPISPEKEATTSPTLRKAVSASAHTRVAEIVEALGDHAVSGITHEIRRQIGGLLPPDQGQRDAAAFEALRARTVTHMHAHKGLPSACLFSYGDLAMRQARANFALNLLGCAGIPCSQTPFPNDRKAAIEAASQQKPAVVVLCSSDAENMAEGPGILEALRKALPQAHFVLAGKPEGWENLKAHGLQDCISAGMDRVAYLEALLDKIGIGKEVAHAS